MPVAYTRRRPAVPSHRHGRRAAVAAAAACLAHGAAGQTWKFNPQLGLEETLTNNVKLESNELRHGDLVTQLTPGFLFSERSAHTKIDGSVFVPVLFYARTGSENKVVPNVSIVGTAELVERLFFIEGSILVDQQYLTPFGPRSDITSISQNRYTSQTYRITPYLKGSAGTDLDYELRDDNIWTKGNSGVVNDAYTNQLTGHLRRTPRPFGWELDVQRSSTKFQDQSKQLLELARARGLYAVDPQLELSASAGYEHNDLLVETKDDFIYGVGAQWHPTERTNVEAAWEHRFFGGSYHFAFDHRTPLSVWSISASRDITTLPQQLASLPGGVDVNAALNRLFQSRVTDPVQREALVNQIIQNRGLPQFLTQPVSLYSQQVQLQESLLATVGFLGVRNTTFLTAYRLRVEPISGSGNPLPPELSFLENNTQYGGSVVWSHSLTGLTALTASVDGSRTVLNDQPGVTKQVVVKLGLTTLVAPLTSLYGGVRYQGARSDITNDYNEAAVFVGVNHRFN